MDPLEYTRMFEMESGHWWFEGRRRMIEALLAHSVTPHLDQPHPRLLDVGCGTGRFLETRPEAWRGVGLDFSRAALGYCRRRGLDRLIQADAARLPVADDSVDLITAFDLVEHLDDDRALVAEAARVVRPGGFLVMSAPAHPILWTGHDVALHHKRRYTRRAFEALFDDALWESVRRTCLFAAILPPAMAIRLGRRVLRRRAARSDACLVAPWLNRLLIGWHGVEAAWLARHDLPWGVSLLTIQRRRGG